MRNYQTGYVLAKETGDHTNVWELYVGKAGEKGQFSFLLSLIDNMFTITDTRTSVEFKYSPRALGGDGVSSAAKIAVDSVNQIVKRHLSNNAAKPKKVSTAAKPKKVSTAHDTMVVEGTKQGRKLDVNESPVCTFDEIPEPAFTDHTVTVGNIECTYEAVNRGDMTQVIVSTTEGKKLTTLIGPMATNTDVLGSVAELANRFYISQ